MFDSLIAPDGAEKPAKPEFDIFHAAKMMIALYGQQAPVYAAGRADEMLATGDGPGYDAWLEMGATIQRLWRPTQNENAAGSAVLVPSLFSRLANWFGAGHAAKLRHPLIH